MDVGFVSATVVFLNGSEIMEGSLQSMAGKSKKDTGLLLASIGVMSASLSGLAGWLYFELNQAQTELADAECLTEVPASPMK